MITWLIWTLGPWCLRNNCWERSLNLITHSPTCSIVSSTSDPCDSSSPAVIIMMQQTLFMLISIVIMQCFCIVERILDYWLLAFCGEYIHSCMLLFFVWDHVHVIGDIWETPLGDCVACGDFNSLWPREAIWWQRFGSTLDQVMACCLTAPSHYLNQCWLIINVVMWHSPKTNFTGSALDGYQFRKVITVWKKKYISLPHLWGVKGAKMILWSLTGFYWACCIMAYDQQQHIWYHWLLRNFEKKMNK